jgi:hypothetical protein
MVCHREQPPCDCGVCCSLTSPHALQGSPLLFSSLTTPVLQALRWTLPVMELPSSLQQFNLGTTLLMGMVLAILSSSQPRTTTISTRRTSSLGAPSSTRRCDVSARVPRQPRAPEGCIPRMEDNVIHYSLKKHKKQRPTWRPVLAPSVERESLLARRPRYPAKWCRRWSPLNACVCSGSTHSMRRSPSRRPQGLQSRCPQSLQRWAGRRHQQQLEQLHLHH